MLNSAAKDRRKSSRQSCPHARLRVGGREATLVDWSFGGLGLRFGGRAGVEVSDEIEVNIYDSAGDGWETLSVIVRRIEDTGTVGVEFKADDRNVESVVIRLLRNSLADVKNPESLSLSAATAAGDGDSIYAKRPHAPPADAGKSELSLSDVLLTEFE